MSDETNKQKPVLGEMIANFPIEELKKAMLHIDRFDEDVITDEKNKAADAEEKLEEISKEIIEDNL